MWLWLQLWIAPKVIYNKRRPKGHQNERIRNHVTSKGHYWYDNYYIEKGIHFGEAKCRGIFYKSWWLNAKCRNMWTLATSTSQKFIEVESLPSTSTSPPPRVYMHINLFYNCVHPFCISTSSIEFVAKQNNTWCLWFLCSLSFVEFFILQKQLKLFIKMISTKCGLFTKASHGLWFFSKLQWWA